VSALLPTGSSTSAQFPIVAATPCCCRKKIVVAKSGCIEKLIQHIAAIASFKKPVSHADWLFFTLVAGQPD
jgi:hypothetical protein